MNRRDFLRPRQFLRPAGQILGAVDEVRALVEETPDEGQDAVLLRCSRQAMATTFEVILPWGTPGAQDIADASLDLIDRLEAQLSVYREDSEVSRLNQNAGRQPVPVEAELFQLLHLSQEIAEDTAWRGTPSWMADEPAATKSETTKPATEKPAVSSPAL